MTTRGDLRERVTKHLARILGSLYGAAGAPQICCGFSLVIATLRQRSEAEPVSSVSTRCMFNARGESPALRASRARQI
jgi:hypothetical protein